MFLDILLLTLSLVVIILIDVPRLVRLGLWREFWAYLIILVMGYTLAFLRVFKVIYP